MFLNFRSRANQLGIVSILLSLAFWIYAYVPRDPAHSRELRIEIPLGALALAMLTALAAGIRGSRWWFLALAGPILRGMLIMSARA